jgi:hypothetical protein
MSGSEAAQACSEKHHLAAFVLQLRIKRAVALMSMILRFAW